MKKLKFTDLRTSVLRDIPVRKQTMIFVLASLFLTMLIYMPAMGGNFFSDDYIYIVNNELLQDLSVPDSWKLLISRGNPWEFLPIRDLSYKIDILLFGNNPTGYHLHNLTLFLCTGVLVWFVSFYLLRLFNNRDISDSDYFIASVASTLFLLHPAHVESVAWISGRKDILSGLFFLFSLLLFIKYLKKGEKLKKKLIWAYIFFILAIFSKSTVITAPVLFAIIALNYHNKRGIPLKKSFIKLVDTIPFFVISLFSLLINLNVGKITQVKLDPFLSEALRTTGGSVIPVKILGYLGKITLFPFNLRLIYNFEQGSIFSILSVFFGIVLILLSLYAMIHFYKKGSIFSLGILTFFVFCLPFMQIIQFETWSLVSERFLFLPVFGFSLTCGHLIKKYKFGRIVFLPVIIVVFTFSTISRNLTWKQPIDLIYSNMKYSPENANVVQLMIDDLVLKKKYTEAFKAAGKVKDPLKKKGFETFVLAARSLDDQNFDKQNEIIKSFALFINRKSPRSWLIVAGRMSENGRDYFNAIKYYYLASKQQSKKAVHHLARVRNIFDPEISKLSAGISSDPNNLYFKGKLADLYSRLYYLEKSYITYKEILSRVIANNGRAVLHYNMALTFFKSRNLKKAAEHMEESIRLGLKNFHVWNNLGLIYRDLGEFKKAERNFSTATRFDQTRAEAAFNLGKMKVLLGERVEAIKFFREADSRYKKMNKSNEFISIILKDLEKNKN